MPKTIQFLPVYKDWEYLKLRVPEPDPPAKNSSFQYELLIPDDRLLINDSAPALNNPLLDIWQKSKY